MGLVLVKNRSSFVAFVAVFTALITVFDVIPTTFIPNFYSGIWDSWIFLLSPIVGILLGPLAGAFSVGLGSLLGHFIYFRDPFEFIFMLGAPLGAAVAAFVYERQWRPVLAIYSVLLAGYFLTPISWVLPLIGVWDTLAGFVMVLLFTLCASRNWWPSGENQFQLLLLLFCTFIALESDILLRIFILIPGQTYWLFYQMTPDALQLLWLGAGIVTAIKVTLASIMTVSVGLSLLRLVPHLGVPLASKPER
ncbi:MAG: hypothetical protein ACFFCO_07440 [Promethearchaeota archaeon]